MGAAAVLTLLGLSAAVTAAAPGPTVATAKRLSNERTYTRWAHPRTVAPIRDAPASGARIVAHLHLRTEEGEPEVYLLLADRTPYLAHHLPVGAPVNIAP